MVNSAVVRNYKLKLYGNRDKTDTARYTIKRFNEYVNMFMAKAYYKQNVSTKGMGTLANYCFFLISVIYFKCLKVADLFCKFNAPKYALVT